MNRRGRPGFPVKRIAALALAVGLCALAGACTPPAVPGTAAIQWPPNDGCAAPAVAEALVPGTLIDRFGPETGTFFSPRGESFRSRSVPYACERSEYRVYRVEKPLEVRTCIAAPWFGEPGGAVTNRTTRSAARLVSEGSLSRVAVILPGGPDRPPPCQPSLAAYSSQNASSE